MFFRMIIAAVVNVLMFRSVGMIERMTVTGDWTIILLLAKKRRSYSLYHSLTLAGKDSFVFTQAIAVSTHIRIHKSTCISLLA